MQPSPQPLASSIASLPGNASPLPPPPPPIQTIPAALYFLVPLFAIVILLLGLSHRRTITILPQSKTKRQRTTACCYFSIAFLAVLSALAGAVGLKATNSEDDGSLADAGEVIHAFLVFKVGLSLIFLTNIHLPPPFRKFTSIATLYSLSLFITLSTGTFFSLLSTFILLPALIPPIMLLAFTAGALILLVYTIRAFIVPPKMYKEQIHHGHYRSGSGIPYDSIYEHQDDSAEQERGIALPVLSDGSPSSPSASSMSFTEKRVSANSAARMICSPESHTPLTRQYGRQVSSTQDATENLATSSYQRQNPDIRAARVRAWKILLSLLLAELCILVSGILGLFRLVFQGILGSKTEELLEIVQSALEVLCIGGVMGGYLLHAYNAAYPGAFSRPMLFYVSEQRAGKRVRSPYPTSPTSPSPLISSFPLSTPSKAKTTLPKKSPLEPKASGLSAPQSRFAFSRSKSFHVRGRGVQSVSSSFSSPFPRSFKGSAGTGKEVAAATATAVNGGPGWREFRDHSEEKTVDIEERRRGLDLSGEPSESRAQEVVVQMGNIVKGPGSPLAQEIEMNRTPSPCAPAIESLPSSIMKRRSSKLMKSRPLSSVPLSGQKSRSTLRRRGTRLPGHMRGSSSPTSPFCPINQAQVPITRPRAPTIRSIDSEDFTDLRDPFAPPTPGTVPAHTASIGMRMSQASSDSPLVFASESLPSTSTSSLRSTPKGHRMSAWGRLPPLPMPVPSPNAPHPARSLKGVKGVVSGWRKGRGRTKSGSSSIVSSLKGRVNSKAEEEEEVWGTRVDMADEGLGEDGVLEEVFLAQKLLRRLDGASSPAVGGHSRGGSSTI